MFKQLLAMVDDNFAKMFFKIQIEKSQNTNHPPTSLREALWAGKTQTNPPAGEAGSNDQNDQKEESSEENKAESVDKKDIGRNDPCPCGSGKKFKKCHGV